MRGDFIISDASCDAKTSESLQRWLMVSYSFEFLTDLAQTD